MGASNSNPARRAARVTVAVVAVVVGVVAGPLATRAAGADPPSPGAAPPGQWTLPVDGPVSRPFAAPRSRYGTGHRGVDLAVAPGTPVRAAGDGTVTFAGTVAGTLHVVVAHAGDLRTSYSFLAAVAVHRGDRVARGDVLGTTGGIGAGTDGEHRGDLHLGLRVGDEYVDPMVLFGPPDLAEVVHLAPVHGGGGEERAGSWAVEALGVWHGLDAAERALAGARPGAGATAGVLGAVGGWFASGVRAASAVDQTVVASVPGGSVVEEFAVRLAAAGRAAIECERGAPAADGTGGSGHLLLAVGGIDSATRASGATFGLPTRALGYADDEVTWFSYAPDGGSYDAADTHVRVGVAARRLAAQLRALHAREPGREVDLVAHSQGGVVLDAFLLHEYDAADPAFPPIGTVVTLASPHEGAPLATVAGWLRGSGTGRRLLAGASAAGAPGSAASLEDLREGSGTTAAVAAGALPDHLDVTTIGGVDDVVVPASKVSVPGATEVVVDPAGPSDHTAITTDGAALAAVRSALERRPPPCADVVTALRGAAEPVLLSGLEHGTGRILSLGARLGDGRRG